MRRALLSPLFLAATCFPAGLAGLGVGLITPEWGKLPIVGGAAAVVFLFTGVTLVLRDWEGVRALSLRQCLRQAWLLWVVAAWTLWLTLECKARLRNSSVHCMPGSIDLGMLFGGTALLGLLTHAVVGLLGLRHSSSGGDRDPAT